jgi:hypothetical protein
MENEEFASSDFIGMVQEMGGHQFIDRVVGVSLDLLILRLDREAAACSEMDETDAEKSISSSLTCNLQGRTGRLMIARRAENRH